MVYTLPRSRLHFQSTLGHPVTKSTPPPYYYHVYWDLEACRLPLSTPVETSYQLLVAYLTRHILPFKSSTFPNLSIKGYFTPSYPAKLKPVLRSLGVCMIEAEPKVWPSICIDLTVAVDQMRHCRPQMQFYIVLGTWQCQSLLGHLLPNSPNYVYYSPTVFKDEILSSEKLSCSPAKDISSSSSSTSSQGKSKSPPPTWKSALEKIPFPSTKILPSTQLRLNAPVYVGGKPLPYTHFTTQGLTRSLFLSLKHCFCVWGQTYTSVDQLRKTLETDAPDPCWRTLLPHLLEKGFLSYEKTTPSSHSTLPTLSLKDAICQILLDLADEQQLPISEAKFYEIVDRRKIPLKRGKLRSLFRSCHLYFTPEGLIDIDQGHRLRQLHQVLLECQRQRLAPSYSTLSRLVKVPDHHVCRLVCLSYYSAYLLTPFGHNFVAWTSHPPVPFVHPRDLTNIYPHWMYMAVLCNQLNSRPKGTHFTHPGLIDEVLVYQKVLNLCVGNLEHLAALVMQTNREHPECSSVTTPLSAPISEQSIVDINKVEIPPIPFKNETTGEIEYKIRRQTPEEEAYEKIQFQYLRQAIQRIMRDYPHGLPLSLLPDILEEKASEVDSNFVKSNPKLRKLSRAVEYLADVCFLERVPEGSVLHNNKPSMCSTVVYLFPKPQLYDVEGNLRESETLVRSTTPPLERSINT